MRLIALLAALLMSCITTVTSAYADKKVALVVGNGAYKNVIDLPNAPNDARDMATALRRLGFLVVEGTDLTYNGMQDKMREFGRALVGADLGLFFYAGHGMQVAGENYLVPIGSVLKREADLEFEAIKVDTIIRQLSREAKIKVVILDSCRDNPLAAELARSMASSVQSRSRSGSVTPGMGAMDAQSVTGTMIAFATAPGTTALDGNGRNSPFTEALLQNIETPDIDIDLMMKRVRGQVSRSTGERQQPWTNSSLTAEYYLNPRNGAAPQQVAALPSSGDSNGASVGRSNTNSSTGFDPRQIEFELWRAAQASNTAAEYNAYLQQYPSGTFAEIARTRIAALGGGAPPASGSRTTGPASVASVPVGDAVQGTQGTEDSLYLGTAQWREIQKKLTGLGFSTSGTDGKPGDATRKAVRDWQSSRKYAATGYLNSAQLQDLQAQPLPPQSASKDDDEEEEAKPRRKEASRGDSSTRTRSANRSSESPSQRRSSDNSSASSGAAVLGTALAIGAGFAIARGIRRR